MKVSIKKSGKTVEKFLQGFNKLDSKVVEVGHFADSGQHSSGIDYVGLLRIWSVGLAKNNEGSIQDPLSQFAFQDIMSGKFTRSSQFKQAISNWYKGLDQASAAQKFAATVGAIGEEEYKNIFNTVASPHMDMADNNTPMYETGELQSKVTSKVTNK